jgi:hypothetical protein
MSYSVMWSGWGTALVFTIAWTILFYLITVTRKERNELKRNINLLLDEVILNLNIIITSLDLEESERSKFCKTINLRFYDNIGHKVVLALKNKAAGDSLINIYRLLELIKTDPDIYMKFILQSEFSKDINKFADGAPIISSNDKSSLKWKWDEVYKKYLKISKEELTSE